MKDSIFWIILLSALILFLGIHLSQFTPLGSTFSTSVLSNEIVNDPNYVATNLNNQLIEHPEHFTNQQNTHVDKFENESTSNDVEAGASTYYNWGLKDNKTNFKLPYPQSSSGGNQPPPPPPPPPFTPRPHDRDDKYCDEVPKKECKKKRKEDECEEDKPLTNIEICRNCDITLNKNIDKYVLKSSVPPCPDMSDYVRKDSIKPDVDLKDWIRKSDIEACPKIDMNEFIRKSEIPACAPPVTCPVCPTCPKQEPPPKCPDVKEFKITEHPDLKDYIKKSEMLKSHEVQKYLEHKMKEAKCHNQSETPKIPQSYDLKSTSKIQDDGLYVGDSLYATV